MYLTNYCINLKKIHRMTILIYKQSQSEFVVTLSELAINSLPLRWLFVFKNDTSMFTHKVVLEDVSTSTLFNKFVYNEAIHGELETGDYSYHAYQVAEDATDETEGHLVEIGKLKVIELENVRPAYHVQVGRKVFGQ
jgi:hypothetical protein